MSRLTLKFFFKLAVTNVCFKCNDKLFCQLDGLALVGSLAVTQANFSMESYEHQIVNRLPKKDLEACIECNRRVTCRELVVGCGKLEDWFQIAILMMFNFTSK